MFSRKYGFERKTAAPYNAALFGAGDLDLI
jgi:hypothetical protein